MANINTAFANITPGAEMIEVDIKVDINKVNNFGPIHNESTQEERVLHVTIPNSFTNYEYMIATDTQGIVLRAHVVEHKQTMSPVSITLKPNDKYVFVSVMTTQPDYQDMVKFIDLEKLKSKPPAPYQGVADLLELVERKLRHPNIAQPMVFKSTPPK